MLQKAVIANDYVTVSELDATTDWVVTFPTKSLYVAEWIPTATGAVNSDASAQPRAVHELLDLGSGRRRSRFGLRTDVDHVLRS